MATTIYFTNRNAMADGVRVYRDTVTFDKDTLPGVLTTLAGDATSFTDETAAQDTVYHYLFEVYLDDESVFSELFTSGATPIEIGPGPTELQVGTPEAGFFGEVPVEDFWTGDELASEIGLTAGTAQNSDSPWLKFLSQGKVLYIAKQSYRYGISWDAIDAQDLVYGNVEVENAQGDRFKVRLLTGGDADPASAPGGEWNALFYPIHQEDPNAQEWGIGYTDAEINVDTGTGRTTWCQETSAYDAGNRVYRGNSSVEYFYTNSSSVASSWFGWRPCLELVTDAT